MRQEILLLSSNFPSRIYLPDHEHKFCIRDPIGIRRRNLPCLPVTEGQIITLFQQSHFYFSRDTMVIYINPQSPPWFPARMLLGFFAYCVGLDKKLCADCVSFTRNQICCLVGPGRIGHGLFVFGRVAIYSNRPNQPLPCSLMYLVRL